MITPTIDKRRTSGLVGSRGFTLIELMIVVAIVGILARIAYGSYQSSVAKSRRSVAQGCLVEQAQFLERYYTTNMSYAGAALPASSAQQCQADLSKYYSFSLPAVSASGFTVKASAIGTQVNADDSCKTMKVTETGARIPVSGCW
jgi:type IV pilus assembly protein PilE